MEVVLTAARVGDQPDRSQRNRAKENRREEGGLGEASMLVRHACMYGRRLILR